MIKSGIAQIDGFLNGGFRGGFITDIFGPPASGKTQLAFQICANAAADGHEVLFMDSKGEFRPERILEILKTGEKRLLEKIQILRITNSREQACSISKIRPNFSLVIIDNITEQFSFEFDRDGRALEKNKLFIKYMRELSALSIERNIPIIITNTIRFVDDREAENMESAISPFTHVKIRLRPDGGRILGQLSTAGKKAGFSFSIGTGGTKNTS